MTKVANPQVLSEIRDPQSPLSRIAALRVLKNDLIGHNQKKQAWVELGAIPLLSELIASRRGAGKGLNFSETNGEEAYPTHSDGRTDEDEICFQAVIIISSLVHGGPAFVSPVLAGDILPSLLSILSSATCPPSLALATLRALNTIADNISLSYQRSDAYLQQLSMHLYSKEHISSLHRIVSQTSHSYNAQLSIALTADLIAKTCADETHKISLAESGVLDALALKLATFVVSQGFVLPGAENYATSPGALGFIPSPAPPKAELGPILRAVAAIIDHSKSRADHFLTSPGIVTVFPRNIQEFSAGGAEFKKSPWRSPYFSGYVVPRPSSLNPIDALLPSVPSPQTNGSSNFPPLGARASFDGQSQFVPPGNESPLSEEHECPLISWLLYVAREESGMTRLMATKLAAILFRLGLAKKQRVTMFGYFLVPLLVGILQKDYKALDDVEIDKSLLSPTLRLKEEAPAILGSLVMDSRELQKHAADSGAIKRLSQLLKESFSTIEDAEKPMWSPVRVSSFRSGQSELYLGPAGISPLVLHRMRYREGILKALAALSLFVEDYRKTICDNGVVPYIIDSMKPYGLEPVENGDIKIPGLEGNPIPTLLAACAAARSLTRSVSVLRTSLIDAGVATPIFALVKFPDIKVQIAATSVICNLAMDFSPMKEEIIKADMIPTLCEHSHSANTQLRLESIWALKHIAYNSSNEIKMKIIEELEPGWLQQVICQDPTDPSARRKLEEDMARTTSGEMDISSPIESTDLPDVIDEREGKDLPPSPDLRMADTVMPPKQSLDTFLTDTARRRKLALNGDLDNTKKIRKDDIQVQEQTLDLIRNLICGTGASEMMDYLFREVGQPDLFEILAEKLRPKTLPGRGRRDSSGGKVVPIPNEIIRAVTHIMIHIAAGLPRHRYLLVFHDDLMKLLLPLFHHGDRQVRVNCVWIVINLTYIDDQSDRENCKERVAKLRQLGVMEHLAKLENDSDSDVSHRTKTALHLMNSVTS